MQSHKRRAVIQQAVKQSADISSMSTHKLNENIAIKMNINKDIMLKNDQDNIQAEESTHQVKWYITVSLYMWDEHNNHGKIKVTMLRHAR